MDYVLNTIRETLIADPTLITLVSADNIHSTYVKESKTYPCIVMSISGTTGRNRIIGIDECHVEIESRSNTSKLATWTIAKRIKTLLDNQERSVTSAYRLIHVIKEIDVKDTEYDYAGNVWKITQRFLVIYSTTTIVATTGANGIIYASKSSVSAIPANEIAKFRGRITLSVDFNNQLRRARKKFASSLAYTEAVGKLVIEEVLFKHQFLDLIWSVTLSATGYLNDGSTSATVYQIDQSSEPNSLYLLYQATKTDDGKKLEIQANKGYCNGLELPLSKDDFSVMNCEWSLLADDNENVVKVSVEN